MRNNSTDFKIIAFPCPKAEFKFAAGLPTYDIALLKKSPSRFPNG